MNHEQRVDGAMFAGGGYVSHWQPPVPPPCIRCGMQHSYGAAQCAVCRGNLWDRERLLTFEESRGWWYPYISDFVRWWYSHNIGEFVSFLAVIGLAMIIGIILVCFLIYFLVRYGGFSN